MDLSKLNEEQKEAVITTEGPVLILAGAGSGKTSTIVNRLVNIIEKGTDPSRILLLTFTNKAANEMTQRAQKMLDEDISKVNGTTYHSFCSELLRRYAYKIDFSNDFTICDNSDAAEMINLIKEKNGYTKEMALPNGKELVDMFSYMLNKEKTLTYTLENRYPMYIGQESEIQKIKEDFAQYKNDKNIFDYDDLLTQVINLFEEYPDICKLTSNYYEYIMVDEYQDSNLLQMKLIKLLRQFENKNICVCGDPEQCFPENTKILTKSGNKNIEDITLNDELIVSSGNGDTKISKISSINKKQYIGDLIKITTKNGNIIKATPEHIAFVDIDFNIKFFIGIAYKNNKGFKLIKNNLNDFDKFWIIDTFNSFEESNYFANYFSLKYNIPMNNFSNLDVNILKSFDLFEEYPHIVNNSFNKIELTMFDNKENHKLSINDKNIKISSNIDELNECSYNYINNNSYLLRNIKLTNNSNKFIFMPFSNIKIGMNIGIIKNNKIISDEVVNVEKEIYNGFVYDLNILNYRNYIANGMVVHNCIYGFRGSLYENILNFPDLFKDCKTIKLNKNYRSNQEILDLSNSITSDVDEKIKNNLVGTHNCGYKPKLIKCSSQNEEARFVLDQINTYRRNGISLKDIAVLVRGSYDSNMLETLIAEQYGSDKIEYQKFGGIKFFERDFIKNLFAYLKIITNYKDEISWFRILKLYPGIGPVYAKKISEGILENGVDELKNPKYSKKKFVEFLIEINDFLSYIEKLEFQEQMEYLVNEYYYKTMKRSIKNMKTTPQNVKKNLRTLDEEIEQAQVLITLSENYKTASKFVNDVLLEVPQDETNEDKLTISTIHSVKGLEFKVVFILGCVEGKFPWLKEARAITNEAIEEAIKEMEEEKRVFYVAITRAKDDLYLMYPQYNIFKHEETELSRFLAKNNVYKKFCEIFSIR